MSHFCDWAYATPSAPDPSYPVDATFSNSSTNDQPTVPKGFEWVLEEHTPPPPQKKPRIIRSNPASPSVPKRSRKKSDGSSKQSARLSSSSSSSSQFSSSSAFSLPSSSSSSSTNVLPCPKIRPSASVVIVEESPVKSPINRHTSATTDQDHQGQESSSSSAQIESPRHNSLNQQQTDDQTQNEKDACPICLDDVDPDSEIAQLPCQHKLHKQCFNELLKNKLQRCPLCKRNVHTGSPDKGEKRRSDNFVDDIVCSVCGYGDGEDQMLLCDGCDMPFHTYCLRPPLNSIPEGDWYCDACAWMGNRRRQSGHFLVSRPTSRQSRLAYATSARRRGSVREIDGVFSPRSSPAPRSPSPERRNTFLDDSTNSLFDSE